MSCTVSYSNNGSKCEILVKPESVTLYRNGTAKRADILLSDDIYVGGKKPDLMSGVALTKIFGDISRSEMLETILQKGQFALTTNELRNMKQQAFTALAGYIVQNYTSAKGRQYSMEQVETILKQCRVNADYHLNAPNNFMAIKNKLHGKLVLKPKPGSIPFSVHLSWKNHAKHYNKIKRYIVSEDTDDTGYHLELLVPPLDFAVVAMLESLSSK